MTDHVREYTRRHSAFLVDAATLLERLLASYLTGVRRIDRVTARAKDPDRFAEKASRLKNGQPKYLAPLSEIQDLLGARVIVFYKHDVESVSTIVLKYFQAIEQKDIVPESQWSFGYFGNHFILPVPGDVVPKGAPPDELPQFFELQIKTLFQHAWSEAEHDIGYKARKTLSDDQKRRFAFTAAQAWGADRVFEELRAELASPNDDT